MANLSTLWIILVGGSIGAAIAWFLSVSNPPPGLYIAMLGFLAVAISLRPERFGPMGTRERVVWIIAAFALLVLEIRVLYSDQDKRDAATTEARRMELDRFQQIISRFDQTQNVLASVTKANERAANLPPTHPGMSVTAKLKRDAITLSQQILQFLAERTAAEPPFRTGGAETWQADTQRMLRFMSDTMSLYSQKFGAKVIASRNALAEHGLTDKELDLFYEYPTNPLGIRAVGERIGALAERLPD